MYKSNSFFNNLSKTLARVKIGIAKLILIVIESFLSKGLHVFKSSIFY